jgi:hypothetical protein
MATEISFFAPYKSFSSKMDSQPLIDDFLDLLLGELVDCTVKVQPFTDDFLLIKSLNPSLVNELDKSLMGMLNTIITNVTISDAPLVKDDYLVYTQTVRDTLDNIVRN